jgi:hypothetical protein
MKSKAIILNLLLLSMSLIVFSQSSKVKDCFRPSYSLENEKLKGKVKSIKTQKFMANKVDGNIIKNGPNDMPSMERIQMLKFNENGQLTEELNYNDTTEALERRSVYNYNPTTCLADVSIQQLKENKIIIRKYECTYNPKENSWTYKQYTDNNKLESVRKYIYNE